MTRKDVLLLGGATASGKTEAAIALAKEFGAEILGADSRQIYRGMPIGTASPTDEQRREVRHHLVGILDPYERYSAARYSMDAVAAIEDALARGKRVIAAGGTGFYLRALRGGVGLASEYDPSLRKRLAAEASTHPPDVLHAWLASRDPARAAAIRQTDRYRVTRALEVALAEDGRRVGDGDLPTLRSRGIEFAYVVLDVPLGEIDVRIERRVDEMLQRGFVEEAERIGPQAPASTAVGYPSALAWLRGWNTRDELRAALVRATRRYARRQCTWFRAEPAQWVRREALPAFAREKLGWT